MAKPKKRKTVKKMKNELSNYDDKLSLGVNVWLPYEIYWRILPELTQYRVDCFLNSFEKWADEHFSQRNNNKNGDSRENK